MSAVFKTEETRGALERELGKYFRREFLNRIDEIVLFDPLSAVSIRQIAFSHINRLAGSLAGRGIALEFSPEAVDLIAQAGFDKENGTRPLARAIDQLVRGPLSQRLIGADIESGGRISVVVQNGEIAFIQTDSENQPNCTM